VTIPSGVDLESKAEDTVIKEEDEEEEKGE